MQVLLHLYLPLQLSKVVIFVLVNRWQRLIRLKIRDRLLLQLYQDVILQELDIFVLRLHLFLSLVQQR